MRLHLAPDRLTDQLGRLTRHLHDHVRSQVAGHHDHGVLEIHGAALAIGQTTVVKHLQQHIEDVGMGLFDLVEQQHRIRLASHRLGQGAALVVADIARRCADQPRDAMLFHEFAHVDPDHVVVAVEQKSCQRLAQLGLADTGRSEEQEGPQRPVRVAQARARTADRIGHRDDGLVLPNHALVQLVLHLQQLVALALHQLAHWNTGGT